LIEKSKKCMARKRQQPRCLLDSLWAVDDGSLVQDGYDYPF
jgi:hypothetical protein